jgi:hypothetical protein
MRATTSSASASSSRAARLLACAAAAGVAAAGKLTLLLDGKPVTPGNYTVSPTTTLSFDNELATFAFGHTSGRFQIEQVVVAGTQIADSADDSWYVDWSGDKAPGEHAEFDTLQVLRADSELLHVAFVDNTNKLLRHSLHNIMTPTTRGMYGFDVMTTMARVRVLLCVWGGGGGVAAVWRCRGRGCDSVVVHALAPATL